MGRDKSNDEEAETLDLNLVAQTAAVPSALARYRTLQKVWEDPWRLVLHPCLSSSSLPKAVLGKTIRMWSGADAPAYSAARSN